MTKETNRQQTLAAFIRSQIALTDKHPHTPGPGSVHLNHEEAGVAADALERVQSLGDTNNALYGENRELARQLDEKKSEVGRLNQEVAALEHRNQDTAASLNSKLSEARANPEARYERIKHQNNEMRVMMNRLHRHLSSGKLEDAVYEWKACNDWLSKNRIEPYTGAVPGYDSPVHPLAAD